MGKNSRGNLAEIARRHYDESLRGTRKSVRRKVLSFRLKMGLFIERFSGEDESMDLCSNVAKSSLLFVVV